MQGTNQCALFVAVGRSSQSNNPVIASYRSFTLENLNIKYSLDCYLQVLINGINSMKKIIFETFNETDKRLKHPLIFSFIVSFFTWNMKAIIVFWLKVSQNLEPFTPFYNELHFGPDYQWSNLFFIPLTYAILYVSFIDLVNLGIKKIRDMSAILIIRHEVAQSKKHKEADKERFVAKEVLAEKNNRIDELNVSIDQARTNLDTSNKIRKALEDESEKIESNLNKSNEEVEKLTADLEAKEHELLRSNKTISEHKIELAQSLDLEAAKQRKIRTLEDDVRILGDELKLLEKEKIRAQVYKEKITEIINIPGKYEHEKIHLFGELEEIVQLYLYKHTKVSQEKDS